MFSWWGRVVVRARWGVVGAGLALVVLGLVWGIGVISTLSPGGFEDSDSESARARARIATDLGRQDFDVLALYSSSELTVPDPAFRSAVTGVLERVRQRPGVIEAVSWYTTPNPALISTDQHATYIALRLADPGDAALFRAIEPQLRLTGPEASTITVQIGGLSAVFTAISRQAQDDVAKAELLSMPILLVLLVVVFRSVVAATMPLLVGGLAILGAFLATRALTYVTEISVFAINVITLIGLGMAVDYALFVVSRFREELDAGADVPEAIRRTILTAGRTVLVSGLTVALALASLTLFPQPFLRSMAYGGVAAVLVAMLAALTVLPAVLAILGRRVNALRVGFRRRDTRRDPAGGFWARLAYAVMRRPTPVIVGTVLVLLVMAVPFGRAQFGSTDERVLPAGTESRVVSERIDAEFPSGGADRISVVVGGVTETGVPEAAVAEFAGRIATLPDVTAAQVAGAQGGTSLVLVSYRGDGGGSTARGIVEAIRALPAPDGGDVLVGGQAAEVVDRLAGLGDGLPRMGLLIALSTMVLLFLAFGSLLLPIKAVLMNLVSIGASFGAVVWVFQEGNLGGLLGVTPTGDLEASQLILMLAILFGLSTDYEVFLLSRVREEWDRSGDNRVAVARGLQRTGSIITSAALLLIVVVGGFTTSGLLSVKMIGFGMIIALVVDATIVRALLVPATMRLLGRANWWLPAPLAAVYRRIGISEADTPPAERGAELVGTMAR